MECLHYSSNNKHKRENIKSLPRAVSRKKKILSDMKMGNFRHFLFIVKKLLFMYLLNFLWFIKWRHFLRVELMRVQTIFFMIKLRKAFARGGKEIFLMLLAFAISIMVFVEFRRLIIADEFNVMCLFCVMEGWGNIKKRFKILA